MYSIYVDSNQNVEKRSYRQTQCVYKYRDQCHHAITPNHRSRRSYGTFGRCCACASRTPGTCTFIHGSDVREQSCVPIMGNKFPLWLILIVTIEPTKHWLNFNNVASSFHVEKCQSHCTWPAAHHAVVARELTQKNSTLLISLSRVQHRSATVQWPLHPGICLQENVHYVRITRSHTYSTYAPGFYNCIMYLSTCRTLQQPDARRCATCASALPPNLTLVIPHIYSRCIFYIYICMYAT